MVKMSGVIQFTNMSHYTCIWLFFEVSTDAVVVHVAEKFAVIQVFDVFSFDFMVYQTSFSKEEVIWKHHCTISLWNKAIEIYLEKFCFHLKQKYLAKSPNFLAKISNLKHTGKRNNDVLNKETF